MRLSALSSIPAVRLSSITQINDLPSHSSISTGVFSFKPSLLLQVDKGFMRLRPRCISIGQLNGRYPITPPTYQSGRLPDTLLTYVMRYLILRPASRLDAFSGYPIRTWLPSFYSWRNNWFTSGTSIPVLSY